MNPFHIDCLYDVGEYFRLKGDYKQANALLEQILFLYEESFGYVFGGILNENNSKVVLSWDRNLFAKTLFQTLVKFIDILGKKACYKAALEYNKFLIKLNPALDPAGGLLILDYNALSARKYDFLIYFTEHFCKEVYNNDVFSLIYLPNYIYSCALAKFENLHSTKKGKNEKPVAEENIYQITNQDFMKALNFDKNILKENHNALLMAAIFLYPEIILKIIDVNEFQKQNLTHSSFKNNQLKNYKNLLSHSFFMEKHTNFYNFLSLENEDDIEGFNKIMDIYVERSKIAWKSNQINLWIKSVIGFIINMLEDETYKLSPKILVEKFANTESKSDRIPFKLRRYKQFTKHSLIEQMQRLDLNNIPDNQNNEPPPNFNPLNMNQGFFSLLLNSLMPWNHLPNNGNNLNNNENPNFDLEQDDLFENEEDFFE